MCFPPNQSKKKNQLGDLVNQFSVYPDLTEKKNSHSKRPSEFWARSRSCKNHRLWLCSACNLDMGQPAIGSNHLTCCGWWVMITKVIQGVGNGFWKLKGYVSFCWGTVGIYGLQISTLIQWWVSTTVYLHRVPNQRIVIFILDFAR